MTADQSDYARKLDALADGQTRIVAAIERIDARLSQLAEQVQGIAETSTRLKLMAGNVKAANADGARRLEAIEQKLNLGGGTETD
ncbi:MAG: hypothetical protein RIE56_10945 [Amphiplicatus sp.]